MFGGLGEALMIAHMDEHTVPVGIDEVIGRIRPVVYAFTFGDDKHSAAFEIAGRVKVVDDNYPYNFAATYYSGIFNNAIIVKKSAFGQKGYFDREIIKKLGDMGKLRHPFLAANAVLAYYKGEDIADLIVPVADDSIGIFIARNFPTLLRPIALREAYRLGNTARLMEQRLGTAAQEQYGLCYIAERTK